VDVSYWPKLSLRRINIDDDDDDDDDDNNDNDNNNNNNSIYLNTIKITVELMCSCI